MEEIINKAIEGGYTRGNQLLSKYEAYGYVWEIESNGFLSDKTFWQALGKSCGWGYGGSVNPDWLENALTFHRINLTESWTKAVEYLSELVK